MKGVAIMTAVLTATLLSNAAAQSVCEGISASGFSELGSRLAATGTLPEGDLLTVRLMVDPSQNCRLAFEVELLTKDGHIRSRGFDAVSLEPVDLTTSDAWEVYGPGSEGGEQDDDDDDELDVDGDDDDENDG